MVRPILLKRLAIVSLCGIFVTFGVCCAGKVEYEGAEQQSSENQSQSRKNAYGTAGTPGKPKGKAGRGATSAEAQARGRGGR